MIRAEAAIGTRVQALQPFPGVPLGTEGVIDEHYEGGVMVAWDLPDEPLPAGYSTYQGVPAWSSRILRDGFGDDELHMLGVVG